ncbi:hypothetical protein AUG19_06515 [archaeon 13_1_20CM_2_54_9]|nr:MAG: hypothetical protein AUJ07_09680 [Crenarchaeota archaeon 13_1_40CM_3_53_5]OLE75055.1 MAG: hypothetical protein AUG19_06515 [archaeon 13_1_20CM_2_54_9]
MTDRSFAVNRVTIIALGVAIIALVALLGATPTGSYSAILNAVDPAGPGPAPSRNEPSSLQSAPDFSLNAAPNTLTVKPGDSGQSTIQLASLSGFSGDVLFTVTVWPSGPSAELNPGTNSLPPGGTASSILTVLTNSSTLEALYDVSIKGTNGSLQHSVSVSVNVTTSPPQGNHPPSLTVPGPESVTAGSPLEFTVSATDPDIGETVTLYATALPSGASFNRATGQFSWTPSSGQTGNYNVTFIATDNNSSPLSDTQTVTIKVEAPPSSAPPQPSQQSCLWCDVANFVGTNLWLVGVGLLGGILVGYVGSRFRSRSRLPRERVTERSDHLS